MTEVIASVQIIGVRSSGEKLPIVVSIGRPYINGSEPETWCCPVSVDPLYPKLADIAGSDSLQSFLLASRLALSLLEGFKEEGGQLFHEDGTEFPLDAYGFHNPPAGRADA